MIVTISRGTLLLEDKIVLRNSKFVRECKWRYYSELLLSL